MSSGLGKIKAAMLKTNKLEREINSLQSEQISKLEEQIDALAQANKIQLELNELLANKIEELEEDIKMLKDKNEQSNK